MFTSIRRTVLASMLALLVIAAASTTVQAQYRRYRPVYPPAFKVYPDVATQQYAANLALLGRAYSTIPPYAYGYNPYPSAVNYGSLYNNYSLYPQYTVPYNPYLYSNAYLYNSYYPSSVYSYPYMYGSSY